MLLNGDAGQGVVQCRHSAQPGFEVRVCVLRTLTDLMLLVAPKARTKSCQSCGQTTRLSLG